MIAAIIVVIVIVIALIGIVAGPIAASKSGGKVGSAFSLAYKQQFGSAPSTAAETAVSTATGIIFNAMGGGQYAVPSQNLRKCIQDYGNAVNWNESKMEIGLLSMSAPCMTKNGNIAPGCSWATEVLEEALVRYCPDTVRRSLGY